MSFYSIDETLYYQNLNLVTICFGSYLYRLHFDIFILHFGVLYEIVLYITTNWITRCYAKFEQFFILFYTRCRPQQVKFI